MRQRAFQAVIAGGILAGFGGVFIKSMTMPATSITFARTLVPVLATGLWMAFTGVSFLRGNYKMMLLGSLLNGIRLYLFVLAFVYTSIGNGIIMFYTWPIFTTIFGVIILKERATRRQVLLLALAFSGIVIAYSDQQFSLQNDDLLGMTSAVAAAFIYSISVIIFKKESSIYHPNELIFYQNLLAPFIYLPFVLVEPLPSFDNLALGAGYGVVLGLVVFYLFFYALKRIEASLASTLAYIEVASALVISYLWFGDILSWPMIIGGALIVTSTILLVRSR